MRRRLALLAALCLALAANSSAGEKKDKQAEGLALINRARELSDIRAPGSPPFRLRARARLLDPVEGSLEGTYILVWMSDDQWREERSFAGFHEVRIGKGTKVWRQRNFQHLPMVIQQRLGTLSLSRHLKVSPDETVKRIREQKHKGIDLRCVELKRRKGPDRKLCLDSEGRLTREEDWRLTYEYSEFVPWAGRLFPRSIRTLDEGKTVAEIWVEELSEPPLEPSLFAPPATAEVREGCLDPDPPEIQEAVDPVYPDAAKQRRIQGTVSVYVLIGTDGRVYNPIILGSADAMLAESTLRTVREWRFSPATCRDVPVETEMVIEVGFHLY